MSPAAPRPFGKTLTLESRQSKMRRERKAKQSAWYELQRCIEDDRRHPGPPLAPKVRGCDHTPTLMHRMCGRGFPTCNRRYRGSQRAHRMSCSIYFLARFSSHAVCI